MKHISTKQPFADEFLDWESDEGGTVFDMSDEPPIISFRDAPYESAEMKQLLSLTVPDEKAPAGSEDVSYKSSKVFPEWVLKNSNWKSTVRMNEEAHTVSDILKLEKAKRNPDQNSMVIKWLMSVWKIAFTMGFKRCGSMLNAFDFVSYQPGENIIEEGKRGLTFYIIISGDAHVHKEGIGIVGQLGQGKSFGEVALTQGNDVRTATVTAVTLVECVQLHKKNFDYYVRDIQDQEKRENFKVLSDCKLFKTWPKGKIEKMSNSCVRHIYDAGDYVFHQGDPPNDLCIVVEGNVNIVKELVIVCKNRWPVGLKEWKERTKKIHKPILLKQLGVSDFFGEVAILKDQPRSTSAIALNRCVLLSLDKLEFLHLISYGNSNIDGSSIDEEDRRFSQIVNKYINDQDILDSVTYFRGGPDSQAVVGDKFVYKHDLPVPAKNSSLVASKTVVVVGPTTHNKEHRAYHTQKTDRTGATKGAGGRSPSRGGSSSPGRSRGSPGKGQGPPGSKADLSLTQELQKEMKADNIADILKRTATAGIADEKRKIDKLKSMGVSVAGAGGGGGTSSVKFGPAPGGRAATAGGGGGGGGGGAGQPPEFRKGSMVDQNGLIFKKAALAAQRRGSLSFATRRQSLQGVDNDPSFIYDPVVLLRKNSAINLGKVYEQVQRHLQDGQGQGEGQQSQDPATMRGGTGGGRSAKLSPLRRGSSYGHGHLHRANSPPPMDALQLMSQWSSYMESGANGGSGINLASTPSRKLSRFVRQTSGMGVGLGSSSRKKSSVGNGGSNNSLAAALAQAMAYANSNSSGTPKAGSNSEAGYGQLGAPYSGYSRSATAPGGNLVSNISASMKNQSPFSSKQQQQQQTYGGGINGNLSHSWEEADDEHDDASFQDFMPTMAMARKNSQASLNRDTSLKLLNKAKISYREVMEG